MARIRLNGQVYDVTRTPRIEEFSASQGGATVQSAAILADLYAHTQALLYIQRNLLETNVFDLSPNIAATDDLRSALVNLYAVDAAADFVTEAAGSIIGLYATGARSAIWTGVVSAATSAKSTLLSLPVEFLPLCAIHVVLNSIEAANAENVTLAQGIVTDLNAGRAIEAEDIANAANAFVNMHAALIGVGSYLGADELLNGNGWTDTADFIANLAKGAFGPAVKFAKDGGAAVSSFFGKLVGAEKYLSNAEYGGELLAMGFEIAEILETFLTGTFGQFDQLRLEEISRAEAFFASIDTLLPPEPTKQVENEAVLSGASANDVSDARFYVDDSFFFEAAGGTQYFQVSLSEALPREVTFKYSIYGFSSSGYTSEGIDFVESMNQSITIPTGQTSAQIPVQIIDDDTIETPLERFIFAVYDAVGATLPNGRYNDLFTGYILDDEYLQQRPSGRTVAEYISEIDSAPDPNPDVPPTSGGPNFIAVSFGTTVNAISFGDELDVTYTVANSGDEETVGGRVDIRLARAGGNLGNGTLLQDFDLPTLDPGEQRTYTRTVEIPSTARGDYDIGIEVVATSLGTETDTSDNVASVPLEVGQGLSGVSEVRVSRGWDEDSIVLQIGDSYTAPVTFRASNEGSPSFTYRVLYSTDPFISPNDIELVRETTDRGLGYFGQRTTDVEITIPTSAPDGIGYIITQVDPENVIREEDETNNVRISEVAITSAGLDANDFTNLTVNQFFPDAPTIVVGEPHRFSMTGARTSPDDPLPDYQRPGWSQILPTTEVHIVISKDRMLDERDFAFNSRFEYVDTNNSLTFNTAV